MAIVLNKAAGSDTSNVWDHLGTDMLQPQFLPLLALCGNSWTATLANSINMLKERQCRTGGVAHDHLARMPQQTFAIILQVLPAACWSGEMAGVSILINCWHASTGMAVYALNDSFCRSAAFFVLAKCIHKYSCVGVSGWSFGSIAMKLAEMCGA